MEGEGVPAAAAGPMIAGMPLNLMVMKEPKGMIRAIAIVFAILAFTTTTGFETETKLEVVCAAVKGGEEYKSTIVYPVEYPFKFGDTPIAERSNCSKKSGILSRKFPMDFSSSAQFYVFTGVISFLAAAAILAFYLLRTQQYESNAVIPVIDLAVTGLLALFWFAGTCAFALTVSDLKFYTNPKYLEKHIYICRDDLAECETVDTGNWATLNISLIFGFANAFIWGMTCWFVFKETSFHQKNIPQGGPPAGYEGYGQQPPQQYQQPQPGYGQQQFAAGGGAGY